LVNNYVEQPKEEGEKKDCPNCGKPLVARLKVYKDYQDKIQWQDEKKTEAHYDKMGDCKGETPKEESKNEKQVEKKPEIKDLDVTTKKIVSNETLLMVGIRKEIEDTLKDVVIDPHPGMVWEMTALIYKKYFGVKEE